MGTMGAPAHHRAPVPCFTTSFTDMFYSFFTGTQLVQSPALRPCGMEENRMYEFTAGSVFKVARYTLSLCAALSMAWADRRPRLIPI